MPAPEQPNQVACWNPGVADSLTQTLDERPAAFALARALSSYIELEPSAKSDQTVADSLVLAHDQLLALGEYEEAYGLACRLNWYGYAELSNPRIELSARPLAEEDLSKAERAWAEGNLGRAADKGAWSASRFEEVITRGRLEFIPNMERAALIAIAANAYVGHDTEGFEDAIIRDYKSVGLNPPIDQILMVHAISYWQAAEDDSDIRAVKMLRHAKTLAKYLGHEVPELSERAAFTGLEDFFTGKSDSEYSVYACLDALAELEHPLLHQYRLAVAWVSYTAASTQLESATDWRKLTATWAMQGSAAALAQMGAVQGRQLLKSATAEQIAILNTEIYEHLSTHDIDWEPYYRDGLISRDEYASYLVALVDKNEELQSELNLADDWPPVNEFLNMVLLSLDAVGRLQELGIAGAPTLRQTICERAIDRVFQLRQAVEAEAAEEAAELAKSEADPNVTVYGADNAPGTNENWDLDYVITMCLNSLGYQTEAEAEQARAMGITEKGN